MSGELLPFKYYCGSGKVPEHGFKGGGWGRVANCE